MFTISYIEVRLFPKHTNTYFPLNWEFTMVRSMRRAGECFLYGHQERKCMKCCIDLMDQVFALPLYTKLGWEGRVCVVGLQNASKLPPINLWQFNSLLKANLLTGSLGHFMSKEQNPQDGTSNKLFTLLLSSSKNPLWWCCSAHQTVRRWFFLIGLFLQNTRVPFPMILVG